MPIRKARIVCSNDFNFLANWKRSCNCPNGIHEQRDDKHLKITALPSLTSERISQLLTHDPNATTAQLLDTAFVSENFVETYSVDDMCVICNSDRLETRGSGSCVQ